MNGKEILLQRLDEIGNALQKIGSALALLGQGSAAPELGRLDDYSDLDFIIIVRAGCKSRFLDQLDWLNAVHPIAYSFKITPEGYKLLFAGGIFCEFAVFEPAEVETPAFLHGTWSAVGRVIWKAGDFIVPEVLLKKRPEQVPVRTRDWLLGEALTNLYAGLLRYRGIGAGDFEIFGSEF